MQEVYFNAYGAYQLARCIVQGIRDAELELSKYFEDDVPPFDPDHPDPIENWSLPPSPLRAGAKPEGS